MTDEQILTYLKSGEELNYGCHGRNTDVMEFIADLEKQGLVKTWDISSSQETRRAVKWIGEPS